MEHYTFAFNALNKFTRKQAYQKGSRPSTLCLWYRCASGCVIECRICNREVAGSNLGLGYFASRSTQPSIPPGLVNEYQLRLGSKAKAGMAHSDCG